MVWKLWLFLKWIFAQLNGTITCFIDKLTCVFIVQFFKEWIWFFFNGVTYLTAIFLEWDLRGVGVRWTKVIKCVKSRFDDSLLLFWNLVQSLCKHKIFVSYTCLIYWEQNKLGYESHKFSGHVLLLNNVICSKHNMSIFYSVF